MKSFVLLEVSEAVLLLGSHAFCKVLLLMLIVVANMYLVPHAPACAGHFTCLVIKLAIGFGEGKQFIQVRS